MKLPAFHPSALGGFLHGFLDKAGSKCKPVQKRNQHPERSTTLGSAASASSSGVGQKAVGFYEFVSYTGSGCESTSPSIEGISRDVDRDSQDMTSQSKSLNDASSASQPVSDMSVKLHLKGTRAAKSAKKFPSGNFNLPSFSRMSNIAEGSYGIVYLARRREHGDLVALKHPKVPSQESSQALKTEYELVRTLDHENVMKALDLIWVDELPIMVMVYVRGKSLEDHAVTPRRCTGELVGVQLASDLCNAVDHIASRGVVHRDIMPRNVIVGMSKGEPCAVLVDFGAARQPGYSVMLSKAGAADYSSPEMKAGLAYGPPIDVWGLGASIAAGMCGCGFNELFDLDAITVEDEKAVTLTGYGWKRNLRTYISSPAAEFVEAACTVSPKKRPVIRSLLDHPFLRDGDCQQSLKV